jgi:hypothetical protein
MDIDANAADFFAALNSGENEQFDIQIPPPEVHVPTIGSTSASATLSTIGSLAVQDNDMNLLQVSFIKKKKKRKHSKINNIFYLFFSFLFLSSHLISSIGGCKNAYCCHT